MNGNSLGTDFSSYGFNELVIFLKDVKKAITEPITEFDQFYEDYETYHKSIDTGLLARAKLIETWIDFGSSLLDVGIGDGTIAEYLMKSRRLNIMGYDISANACEKARKLGINVVERNINSGLGLSDNEYDYILMSEVLEHLTNPSMILKEAIRHARKGVIVTIPNSAYIRWRIHLMRGFVPRQSFTHLHFWSIRDFELFCKLLDIKTLAFKTFLPRYLMRFKNLLAFQQCWLLQGSLGKNSE